MFSSDVSQYPRPFASRKVVTVSLQIRARGGGGGGVGVGTVRVAKTLVCWSYFHLLLHHLDYGDNLILQSP